MGGYSSTSMNHSTNTFLVAQEERNLEGLVRRQNVFPNSSVLQRSFIFATINHSRNLGRARYEQLASVGSTVLWVTRRKSGGFNHRLPSHPLPASHTTTVHATEAKSLNHRTQTEATHELMQNGGTVEYQRHEDDVTTFHFEWTRFKS